MANLPATNKVKTIRDLLEKSKSQFALAVPRHLNPERLMRVGMTAIQRTPKLLECEPTSLISSLMQCAQLGLEPDGILGHAYLVPFKNKKTNKLEAQFMVGYKGLISLARKSGEVQSINAQVVYEHDTFDFCYGLDDKLEHKPSRSNRGKAIGVYCVAKFKDGGHAFEVMWTDQIEDIRKQSKAKDDGPWVTHWDEMAKKTVTRRLAKYLPLSVEFQRAAALDEYADAGIFPNSEEGEVIDISAIHEFDKMIPKDTDVDMLNKFIGEVAEGNDCSIDAVKANALKDIDNFMKLFVAWNKKQKSKDKEGKTREKKDESKENSKKTTHPPIPQTPDDFKELSAKEQTEVIEYLIDTTNYDKKKLIKAIDKFNATERETFFVTLAAKYESMNS